MSEVRSIMNNFFPLDDWGDNINSLQIRCKGATWVANKRKGKTRKREKEPSFELCKGFKAAFARIALRCMRGGKAGMPQRKALQTGVSWPGC